MSILDTLGAFKTTYGKPSKGTWNLDRGVYRNSRGVEIVFFYAESNSAESKTNMTAVDSINDSGGKRLAVYEYPYVDGQRVADLGRKGETMSFNIKFFGTNYQQRMKEFIDVVLNDSGGSNVPQLIHPVRGTFNVRFRDYEFVHKYDEWNAITIKATFIEDNQGKIQARSDQTQTPDAALSSNLDTFARGVTSITATITSVTSLLGLPASIKAEMLQRLSSITAAFSALLGQLAATFSSSSVIQTIASQSPTLITDIISISSGTVASASGVTANIPPVFQAGLTPSTQASVTANAAAYTSANQITPQHAVFKTNQIRQSISAAILDCRNQLSNSGYDIEINYRQMAVQLQTAVEVCLTASQKSIVYYITPRAMSLRQVAFMNQLSYDRQNDIEALNPYLPSVNYIPAGYTVIVPAA